MEIKSYYENTTKRIFDFGGPTEKSLILLCIISNSDLVYENISVKLTKKNKNCVMKADTSSWRYQLTLHVDYISLEIKSYYQNTTQPIFNLVDLTEKSSIL